MAASRGYIQERCIGKGNRGCDFTSSSSSRMLESDSNRRTRAGMTETE